MPDDRSVDGVKEDRRFILHLPSDQSLSRSESGVVRTLYDCSSVPVGSARQHSVFNSVIDSRRFQFPNKL